MGSGFKTFTAGEVLTASDVNNYLMEQSVMTFGGSAARSSAIGTANFEEGMTSFLTDTDKLEVYNGTNWVSVAPTSTQGLTLISTSTFSGVSSQSVSDVFSATYDNYRIIVTGTATVNASLGFRLRVSGTDATTNYSWQRIIADGTNVTAARDTGRAQVLIGLLDLSIPTGLSIDIYEPFKTQSTVFRSTSALAELNGRIYDAVGYHSTSASYTGFTLMKDGGSGNISGIVRVYGYNN
jgi:hypothetical protein